MWGKVRDNLFWLTLIVAAVLIFYLRPFRRPEPRDMAVDLSTVRTEMEWTHIEEDLRRGWDSFFQTTELGDGGQLPEAEKMRKALAAFQEAVTQAKDRFAAVSVPEGPLWHDYHTAVKHWIEWHDQILRVDLADFVRYAEGFAKPLTPEQLLDYSKRRLQLVQAYGKEHRARHDAFRTFRDAKKASRAQREQ